MYTHIHANCNRKRIGVGLQRQIPCCVWPAAAIPDAMPAHGRKAAGSHIIGMHIIIMSTLEIVWEASSACQL